MSGALRRYSYARYSEARAAHWLILLAADRVDAWESHLRSLATQRPDNPVTETGILSEGRRRGIASRRAPGHADHVHQALDPVVVAGPWVVGAVAASLVVRRLVRRPQA